MNIPYLVTKLKRVECTQPEMAVDVAIATFTIKKQAEEIEGWIKDQRENLTNQVLLQREINDLRKETAALRNLCGRVLVHAHIPRSLSIKIRKALEDEINVEPAIEVIRAAYPEAIDRAVDAHKQASEDSKG